MLFNKIVFRKVRPKKTTVLLRKSIILTMEEEDTLGLGPSYDCRVPKLYFTRAQNEKMFESLCISSTSVGIRGLCSRACLNQDWQTLPE